MLDSFLKSDKSNLLTGLLYVVLGGTVALLSLQYKMGTASNMGPGYFPFWLGTVLFLIGAAVLFRTLRSKEEPSIIEPVQWRPFTVIVGSVVAFGLVLKLGGGFILATLVLIAVSGVADRANHWRSVAISAIVMAVFGALVFVVGLKIDAPLWPAAFIAQ